MNLKDASIGIIERAMLDFVDEKMPQKTRERVASYMSTIAAFAFRLGYQFGKDEMTEEQFNALLYDRANPELTNLLTEITYRVRV